MKVCFITFGCRLNRAEALDEEARYLAAGWELTDVHKDADRFVIRGCSVTARAQRDTEKLIAHLRRKYPNTRTIVQGCITDRSRPVSSITSLAKRLKISDEHDLPQTDEVRSAISTRTARAYLKVQDGCSGGCTFCIVPKFRGKSVSEDFTAVLDKARRFIDAGYHEIVITGCNLALYASQGKTFADLLAALAELGGTTCRFRIGSFEPGPALTEVIAVMADHANICRFLHLPIQSGSERILLAMRRPYRVRDVETAVREAIRRLPFIGLGCDLMTGFPGETDIDFMATKSLLSRLPFSNAHVFPYSERPETKAASFTDVVPREIRSARAHELSDLITEKRELFARRFRGRSVEVVIEDEGKQAGWTSEYLWFKRSNLARIADALPRKSRAFFTVTSSQGAELRG